MSIERPHNLIFGLGAALALFGVWIWPLPGLGIPPFTAHMVMHMTVVAIAAPLIALALSKSRLDLALRAGQWSSPITASVVEMAAVWAWHAPLLHHAARHEPLGLALEQATFLGTGLYLWTAAIAAERAISGVIALLLTSMHMTLLGALIALTNRELYPGHGGPGALFDQQLGGVVMIFVGGAIYLAGGLALAHRGLLARRPA